MSENNRVNWSEGLFLRPQHFQQQDRYTEFLVNGRCHGLRPFDWGFSQLKLDTSQLAIGKVALLSGRGIFQDGTPFEMPRNDGLPQPLELPSDLKNNIIYLSLPLRRPDATEMDSEVFPDGLARYSLGEREVRDHNTGYDGCFAVQIGKLKTRLLAEREERSGYACLGVARVIEVRANKTVLLDEEFIPPALNCFSTGLLGGFLRELQGLLHVRGEELARIVAGAGRGGVAEVSDFLLLQMINRYEPWFEHLASTAVLHPEDFYRLAVQLAGELATFYRSSKRPNTIPVYEHDDLRRCFTPLMKELRDLFSKVIERNVIQIPLHREKEGFYRANRPDEILLRQAIFVLAAKSHRPIEMMRKEFPARVKIGPVERIHELVRSHLPGILLASIDTPRQIPYHAGFTYFELNKKSELWNEMEKTGGTGGFALHIGGNFFPGLELEMWAIKKL